MWYTREPDQVIEVDVSGHTVVAYSYGESEHVLLALNGGPGVACDYLREPLVRIVDAGYRLVTYDQLGTGRSGRPDDPSLWHIERCAEEVETVRNALGLDRFNLLGHSWGGALAIEYAVRHRSVLNSLVLEETFADVPFQVSESRRVRQALGAETVAMMQGHEAEGTFDHPEYLAAATLLDYRHVCRLQQWPEPLLRSYSDWNQQMKLTLLGPRTFVFDGNLRDWSREADLPDLHVPTLVTAGLNDELTPATAMRMHRALPDSEFHLYRTASHTPFYETPDEYLEVVLGFLDKHRN